MYLLFSKVIKKQKLCKKGKTTNLAFMRFFYFPCRDNMIFYYIYFFQYPLLYYRSNQLI